MVADGVESHNDAESVFLYLDYTASTCAISTRKSSMSLALLLVRDQVKLFRHEISLRSDERFGGHVL